MLKDLNRVYTKEDIFAQLEAMGALLRGIEAAVIVGKLHVALKQRAELRDVDIKALLPRGNRHVPNPSIQSDLRL